MNSITMNQIDAEIHGGDRLRAQNDSARNAIAFSCDFTVPTSPAGKFGTTPTHPDSIPLSCPTA